MLKILLIEDSEDDAILIEHLLRHHGFETPLARVDTPESLEAALRDETWDMILTDFNMPRFSGLDAIEQVTRDGVDTPIIVLSGAVGEEMAATLMREGAKDFIRKDNMARLVPAIERELKDAADRRARRKAEQERAEGEKREQVALAEVRAVQEVNRLKNLFVNSISHELRNPLTSLLGYIEMLEDELGGPLTEEQRGYLMRGLVNIRRLQRLVDDLLDYARIEAGTFSLRFAMMDFRAVVAEMVESMRPQAEIAGIGLDAELPDAPVMATVDPERLEQVLANLLSNALKFTPEGGSVRVRLTAEVDTVKVAVTDTGTGIAEADQSRLFQLFSQLDEGVARGGTGLGLAISKNLIEAHGGTIDVSSEPGSGSTFCFTVPRTPRTEPLDGEKVPEAP